LHDLSFVQELALGKGAGLLVKYRGGDPSTRWWTEVCTRWRQMTNFTQKTLQWLWPMKNNAHAY